MTDAQAGVFGDLAPFNHYLEFTVDGAADPDTVRAAAAKAIAAERADGQTLVAAFGADLWGKFAPGAGLGELRNFDALTGPDGMSAPATQHDIWVWINGPGPDVNLDTAMKSTAALNGVARVDLELAGFAYHGNRDLIGFVDGTANPKDQAARKDAALVSGRGGGSFLMTQKWVHDLGAFNALSVTEQEGVVGRTKEEDVELEGEAMPLDSHVSRTDVSEDGVAMKIWRRSSPYGTVAENGLYFVAFACNIRRFDSQLERMYGLSGDGLHDHLIHFSTAVSGAYWYAPGQAELKKVFG